MPEIAKCHTVLKVADPLNEEGVSEVEQGVYQQVAMTPEGLQVLLFAVSKRSSKYCNRATPIFKAECDRFGRMSRADNAAATAKIYEFAKSNRSK
jgi:hypothetical protein